MKIHLIPLVGGCTRRIWCSNEDAEKEVLLSSFLHFQGVNSGSECILDQRVRLTNPYMADISEKKKSNQQSNPRSVGLSAVKLTWAEVQLYRKTNGA